MSHCGISLCACMVLVASAPSVRADDAAAVPILDGSSPWRVLYSWDLPQAKTAAGYKPIEIVVRRGKPPKYDFMTLYPPDGWTAAGFDDSVWPRQQFLVKYVNGEPDGRSGGGAPNLNVRQISLRGKFTVADPAKAPALTLSMAYRGGVIVYLNGAEIARRFLPAGPVAAGAPAEMCDLKAYLNEEGKPLNWFHDRDLIAKEDRIGLRVRHVADLALPAKLLARGTNVLAIEIHAVAFPEACLEAGAAPWAGAGLCELQLRAAGEGVTPNVCRPAGLQVWNTQLSEEVYLSSYGDPHESLKPVRIGGARNGTYSGRVMVSSDAAIENLSAACSPLAAGGGAKLPASAARIGYGRFWSVVGQPRDDAVVETCESKIEPADPGLDVRLQAVRKADGLPPAPTPGAMQSVFITVRIPKDAAPGEYRGTLTISADGRPPVAVPVELTVVGWTLPDPQDFQYWFGLIQSPDGVALRYGVPPWSARHWELIGRSLEYVAATGGKVLFIPLVAETEYGNEQSMVLWRKGADGKLTPDFTNVEKYVAVAADKLPGPTYVACGVWQFSEFGKAPLITVVDEKSGKAENIDGPAHGSDASLAFWKPVLTRVREILATHGWADRMLLGFGSDRYPKPETAEVFRQILPDVGWEAQRHPPRGGDTIRATGGEVPVKYISSVWGSWSNWDPDERRVYGWKFPCSVEGGIRTWLDRRVYDSYGFVQFRTLAEQSLLADRRGLGQVGTDFWGYKSETGRWVPTTFSRFPHSANVGAGNKGITNNQFLYPGPDGAVPTVRFEMVRQNIQECEARIYLEQLLVADPCPLPADLAARCQATLDERTRWHRIGYSIANDDANLAWPYTGVQARVLALYRAAAEAAAAMRH